MVARPHHIRRFDVALVELDPTRGSEIQKTRPCVVVSPDEANAVSRTLMVAPMTTGSHPYVTRLPCVFRKKRGVVVIDQLRTVDRERVVKVLGHLDTETQTAILDTLAAYFAP